MVCGISYGLAEIFWCIDPDITKNADMEITLLARMLHLASEQLDSRGLSMPLTLSQHTDNATAEGKNQTVAKFLAHMVFLGKFQLAEALLLIPDL